MKKYSLILFLSLYGAVVCAQSKPSVIAERIPFTLFNNHIYLQVRVNNSKPLWFVLDTGAGDIIGIKHAKELNLALYSSEPTSGTGDSLQDVAMTKNISFQIDGTSFTKERVAVVALQAVEDCSNQILVDSIGNVTMLENVSKTVNQQPMDGILGYGFFENFVVEIDYKQQFLTLYDPNTYHYQGKGGVVPIEIEGNHIFTYASIKESDTTKIHGRFMIDTGLILAVALNSAFIEKNNLLPPPAETTPFRICGLGGTSKAQIGILPGLFIQNIYIDNARTLYSQANSGVLSSTNFDGIIGNAIFRHFKVIFDYSHKQMILE